jgi:thioredoxin reductase (NADPH)
MTDKPVLYDIAIIGGGPGGITAGIYSGRGLLKTLVIDKMALGGAVLLSARFDNFPGFPGGVESWELAQRMEQQLREHEVDIEIDDVQELNFLDGGPLFELVCLEKTYRAKSVILASGSIPTPLKVPGARDLLGRGVSTCAVCDGAFYRDKPVAVVGGGNSAVEEGIYLTTFASKVTIIHRRDELRAREALAKKAFEHPKVEFLWDSVVDEVLGDEKVTGLKIKNVKTEEISQLDVEGVFVYIGAIGNTGYVKIPVEMDKRGYIKAGALNETNIPGLFAIGDVRWEPFKQAVIACGQGAQASLMADKYIKDLPKELLARYE